MLPEILGLVKRFTPSGSSADRPSGTQPAVYPSQERFNDAPPSPAPSHQQSQAGSALENRSPMQPPQDLPRRGSGPGREEMRMFRPDYSSPDDAIPVGIHVPGTSPSSGTASRSRKPGSHKSFVPRDSLSQASPHAALGHNMTKHAFGNVSKSQRHQPLRTERSRGENVPARKTYGFPEAEIFPASKRQKTSHTPSSPGDVVDLTLEDHPPAEAPGLRRTSTQDSVLRNSSARFAAPRSSGSGHSAASGAFALDSYQNVEQRMNPKHYSASRRSSESLSREQLEAARVTGESPRGSGGYSANQMQLSGDESERQEYVMDNFLDSRPGVQVSPPAKQSLPGEPNAQPVKRRLMGQTLPPGLKSSALHNDHLAQDQLGDDSPVHTIPSSSQRKNGRNKKSSCVSNTSKTDLVRPGRASSRASASLEDGSEDELTLPVRRDMPPSKQRESTIGTMDAEKPERTKSPYFDGSAYATGTSKSDIKASRFTGDKGAKTSSHESKGQGTEACQWSLKSFKIPGCPEIQSPDLELVAPPGSKRFNVFTKDGPVPVGQDHAAIDCGKVTKVLTVEDGVKDSNKMCFTGVRDEHGIYKRFVEFSGAEELEGFKRYLASHTTIKVRCSNPHQIDRMFASADETVRRNSLSEPVDAGQEEAYLKSQNSRRSQESIERKHDKERACEKGSITTTTNGRSRNSTKLISQLQADIVPNETSARTTRGIRRAEGSPDTDSFQALSVSRTTRSSARTRDEGQDITYVEASPESKKMKLPFRLPDKWKSSLPYPPKGRRVIEVNHEDLYRLNDDEYLNDTLIEFYLAWATDEAEKGGCLASDKVFRFNTFFYTALTKGSNGQKIDYGSVRRWTSKTDIFTYDYLVIPINENYHWYLAIIYNLPTLVRRLEHSKGDDGDQKDVETLSLSKKNSAKHGLIAAVHERLSDQPGTSSDPVKETENSGDAMDVDVPLPEHERTRLGNNGERSMDEDTKDTSLQANGQKESSKGNPKGKKGRKKQPATVKRADLDRPTIILFDSIGQAHTPTARNLKEYLVKEAEVKHGLALDAKVFQTVVAKGIPQQNNVYDCGVFLCLYFEKFINGPDVFVRKLLHKEMDGKRDWPNTDPSKTRRDMLDLLDGLYQELRREQRELKRKRKTEKSKLEEILSVKDKGSSGVAKQSSPVNTPEPEPALQPRREVHEEASSKSRPRSQEPQRSASASPGTPPLLRPSPEVMQQSSPPLLSRRKEQKSTGSPEVVVPALKESRPRDYDIPHPHVPTRYESSDYGIPHPHIPTRDSAPPIFKGIQSLPSPRARKRRDPSIEYDMEEPVQSVEGMEGVEQGLADDDESMIYNGEDEDMAQEVIDIGDSQPQDDIHSKARENHTTFLLELREAAAARGPSRSESASSYRRKNRKQQKQPEVIELDGSQP